jgi:hypothetical protein
MLALGLGSDMGPDYSWATASRAESIGLADIPPGDFDWSRGLDVRDIDQLSAHLPGGGSDPKFDLNGDLSVNDTDRTLWVHDPKKTWFGDANLDGQSNSSDLVEVFQAGRYETGTAAGWAAWDCDGDGAFASGDLVLAFQDGGYESGPRGAHAVPEPDSLLLIAGAVLMGGSAFKRIRSRDVSLGHVLLALDTNES